MRRQFAEAAKPAFFAALVMGLVGALAVVARQSWLFPSLGPTLFLLVANPAERSWNVFAGHAAGVVAGFAALFLLGGQDAPTAFEAGFVTASRAAATALAVGATMLLQFLADARHPPAAATTMLITLGGLRPDWRTVTAIAIGVGLVAAFGFAAQCLLRGHDDKTPGCAERTTDQCDVA